MIDLLRTWPWVALIGCSEGLVGLRTPPDPYFVISGPLEPGTALSGEHTRGVVAWVWVVDGRMGGALEEVPMQPRLYAYELALLAPPAADERSEEVQGFGEVAALVGLPLLVELEDGAVEDLPWEPWVLLDHALDAEAGLTGLLDDPAIPAAAAVGHLVMGASAPEGRDLASTPAWTTGGSACALDGLVHGLTLYRREGVGCSAWRALAPPGERDAFQGVSMGAL